MAIHAVTFDIGGVLEITPDLGLDKKWEQKLNLQTGKLNECLGDIWRDGSIGAISIEQVHTRIGEVMGMNETLVNEFMNDLWHEYLGTLNIELAEYFRALRPKYQTAIISNSFVGAREKEEEKYRFSKVCDFIIYSHEVGISKPDPRIFSMTCERLGLQPSEVIFVDDHEEVMKSARELGIHCIEHKDNAQTIAEIEACILANASPLDK
jgi:epoxide hydrolase-like predicted phosphatase